MRAGLERGEIRQQQLSSDTYRSSDDDDVEYADTLDRALARNIDIDSEMIEQELNGISEPLSVSILFILHSYITPSDHFGVAGSWKKYWYNFRSSFQHFVHLKVTFTI